MQKIAIALLGLVTLAAATSVMPGFLSGGQSPDEIFLGEPGTPGYVSLDSESKMFYWFWESRATPSSDPLVIWLTGGPGCSSELAIFMENGPFKVNDDLSLKKNDYSWNTNANLLYVDNPLGTGFSYTNDDAYVTDEKQVASDFYAFFTAWLDKYPVYKGRDLYITGESYAGHYIPAIGSYFIKEANSNINLKGVAIGNGWVDPTNQFPAYATFAKENNMIDASTASKLSSMFENCVQYLEDGSYDPSQVYNYCEEGTDEIIEEQGSSFNVYNIKAKCEGNTGLCYPMQNILDFLKRDDVVSFLGVSGIEFTPCNNVVGEYLGAADEIRDLASDVASIVESGATVLAYSGDLDFICNWRGGEAWTNNLDWSGKEQFANAEYKAFKTVGDMKNYENFYFLKVFNAGHLVPHDQPENALTMLNALTSGEL